MGWQCVPRGRTSVWERKLTELGLESRKSAGAQIWTKFGSLMQNNMQITAKWSRSKPEVGFQYCKRLLFKNGSSYISAVNWEMSTKFGLLIDFVLLKVVASTSRKPEIVFSLRGCHLEKSIWRHIPQWVFRLGRNSVGWCRMTCRLRRNGLDRNRK